MEKMTSNRPYLLRAMYDWLVDNDCTPHIVVNAYHSGVSVPQQYVSKGQIVLNIAPRAITNFVMDNEAVAFTTRFGGVPTEIFVPTMAILGIYARENGQGMMFPEEDIPSSDTGGDMSSSAEKIARPAATRPTAIQSSSSQSSDKKAPDKKPFDDKPRPAGVSRTSSPPKRTGGGKGKPSLKIIK